MSHHMFWIFTSSIVFWQFFSQFFVYVRVSKKQKHMVTHGLLPQFFQKPRLKKKNIYFLRKKIVHIFIFRKSGRANETTPSPPYLVCIRANKPLFCVAAIS